MKIPIFEYPGRMAGIRRFDGHRSRRAPDNNAERFASFPAIFRRHVEEGRAHGHIQVPFEKPSRRHTLQGGPRTSRYITSTYNFFIIWFFFIKPTEFFYFTVVRQNYDVKVYDEYIISGNTALLRCQIPNYATDFIVVSSWVQDGNINIYPNGNIGNNDAEFIIWIQSEARFAADAILGAREARAVLKFVRFSISADGGWIYLWWELVNVRVRVLFKFLLIYVELDC